MKLFNRDDLEFFALFFKLGIVMFVIIAIPLYILFPDETEPRCFYGWQYDANNRQILNEVGGGIPCKKQS